MKKTLFLLTFFLSLFFLYSCKDNTRIDIGLEVNEISLKVDETYQIELKNLNNNKPTFKSTDESIVIVDEFGLIKALKAGEAKIKVKFKSFSEEIIVNVDEVLKINGTETFDSKILYSLKDDSLTENIKLSENSLTVSNNETRGIYVSKPILIEEFNELVLTYNMNYFKQGRAVFSVAIGNNETFSDFFIMAAKLNDTNRSIGSQDNDFGKVNIDTLINKDVSNNYIRLKFELNKNDDIYVKNLSVTTKKANKELVYNENNLINKVLDVPKIAQLKTPNIGNLICSPTSLTMVLNYYNKDLNEVDTAYIVQDDANKIFGNWTLNASYAGSFNDLKSRVEYIHDFDVVINYIKNDIPVIFSINTKTIDDLKGSIMAFPAGHLIVLIGFKQIDGVWHGVFNDPAEHVDDKVIKYYNMDQVLNVWRNYTYIIDYN